MLIYVHGANTTVERAAGQASQIRHFSGRHAVVVLFAWPTAENFLRYSRDVESAFGAAPHLVELIRLLAGHTEARNIDVFTYSAGATVGSHALALLAGEDPELATRLGEVYHAAPDADLRDFVDDLAAYAGPARGVTAAVNLGDSALRLAAAVSRASRAGRPDLGELRPEAAAWLLEAADEGEVEIVQVRPETMPGLAATLAHLLVRRSLGEQRPAGDAALRPAAGRARPRGRRRRLGRQVLDLPGHLSCGDAGALGAAAVPVLSTSLHTVCRAIKLLILLEIKAQLNDLFDNRYRPVELR